MRGVINLRGSIVPIVDLRARFAQGDTEPTKSHVVVIVAVAGRTFGILVDGVSDILTVSAEEIRDIPSAAQRDVDSSFIDGLITVGDEMVARIALAHVIGGVSVH